MDSFISNYIESLTKRQKEKIGTILNDAKVSKESLPDISKQLNVLERTAPLFLQQAAEKSRVLPTLYSTNMRDARIRVEELFRTYNMISLLAENIDAVLLSEVKVVEDELTAVEKLIDTYSFLIADNNSYGYSYMETFSDKSGFASFDLLPDRSGFPLGPSDVGDIVGSEGVLVLPNIAQQSYPMVKSVVRSNVTAVLEQANASSPMGFRATVDVQSPITSSLPEAGGEVGAQVVLEYALTSPSPVSDILIRPYADTPMDLLAVYVFNDFSDGSRSRNLVSSKVFLDRPKTIVFPTRNVARVQLVLNQPAYTRVSTMASAEDDYRRAYNAMQDRIKYFRDHYNLADRNQFANMLATLWRTLNSKRGNRLPFEDAKSIPAIFLSDTYGPASIQEAVETLKRGILPGDRLGRMIGKDAIEKILHTMLKNASTVYNDLVTREVAKFQEYLQQHGLYDPTGVMSPVEILQSRSWVYRYALNLEDVAIGVTSSSPRAVYLSPTFDSDGDIGIIKIKTSEYNFRDLSEVYDNSLMTSVEYSVTNKTTPTSESDWKPILPSGTSLVESERLFPDDIGKAFFRFPADPSSEIGVFKNNRELTLPLNAFIYDDLKQTVVGVKIPTSLYTSADYLTVRYYPTGVPDEISFEGEGFANPPLVAAYDNSGAGETFTSASTGSIQLQHLPYVDAKLAQESTYDSTYGMSDFSPVTIKLSTGETLVNLTNYKDPTYSPTLPQDGLHYYHSGKNIIFGGTPSGTFTVYYQYLQNNVRLRAVLRCNTQNFVSPKVDYVQVKAKIRKPTQTSAI